MKITKEDLEDRLKLLMEDIAEEQNLFTNDLTGEDTADLEKVATDLFPIVQRFIKNNG